LFVLGLIIYIVFRFNETKNPVPSKTTHNTMLEVAWTMIPVLILVGIADSVVPVAQVPIGLAGCGCRHQGDRKSMVLVVRISSGSGWRF
jgi:hypothetical protein